MSDQYRNYIVTFQPKGEETVDKMRVIDAWSSTSDLAGAYLTMRDHQAADEYGHYAACGVGRFTVAEQGESEHVAPFKRFVGTSERSTKLAEGVYLYALTMDAPLGVERATTAEAFEAWAKSWPELAEHAKAMQSKAFDFCAAI